MVEAANGWNSGSCRSRLSTTNCVNGKKPLAHRHKVDMKTFPFAVKSKPRQDFRREEMTVLAIRSKRPFNETLETEYPDGRDTGVVDVGMGSRVASSDGPRTDPDFNN